MNQSKRKSRRSELHLESLESRNLLSLLITAKPTLEVQPAPPRVVRDHQGIRVVQPTTIQVFGTAQPNVPGSAQFQVAIFAEDGDGNLVNDGRPLANATPDTLGRYRASFALPSTTRRDLNFLVALETATGALPASVSTESTGITGLNGTLAINGTALRSLNGSLALNPGTLTNLTATISNPPGTTLSGGSATESARTGAILNGVGAIAPTNGTFTQIGSATLAATTSRQVTLIQEFAASDPVRVRIHQSPGSHSHLPDGIRQAHGERASQPRRLTAHQVSR